VGTRRIKKKLKKTKQSLAIEYYQLPFLRLHAEMEQQGCAVNRPHEIRSSFWNVVPPGTYSPDQGRELVMQYAERVESEMSRIVSARSIGYWLHAYRRVFPGAAGENKDPVTIGLVRAITEAAVFKYGQTAPCSGIAFSNEVPIERVLRGRLMDPGLKPIRQLLTSIPQLVLVDFGLNELIELYQLEKLGYEIWKCGATLRGMGKGVTLLVPGQDPWFGGEGSNELSDLLRSVDARAQAANVSATGTVFGDEAEEEGLVPLPTYNLEHEPASKYQSMFAKFGLDFPERGLDGSPPTTNFLWGTWPIRAYRTSHEPFASAFQELHQVSVDDILAATTALLIRAISVWNFHKGRIFHYWQRAYEGPLNKVKLFEELSALLPVCRKILGIPDEVALDVVRGCEFMSLADNRKELNVLLAVQHPTLVPYGNDNVFVDYAWISRRLYSLYFKVELKDQNFKGDALERLVQASGFVLPRGGCTCPGVGKRQVDASFEVGDTLIIVECRAVGRSLGVERGDPAAVRFRTSKIEKALKDADEKAAWLARNPIGSNYDITKFRAILPIGVTPFVEFIPSLDKWYWINKWYWIRSSLPRVLAPRELSELITTQTADLHNSWNLVPIEVQSK
jgi:hypothetical protein